MANSMTKAEAIAWEAGCEAFENNNVFADRVEVYKPNSGMAELAGQTVRHPYANQIESSRGLDVSSNYKDVADITVPLSLAESDIYNSSFKLSATERLVERRIRDNAVAAVRKISSDVSTDIRDLIIDRGTLVGAETTALTDFKHFGKADTIFDELEVSAYDNTMYLGPRTKLGVNNEIAMRATDYARDGKTYATNQLNDVAGFSLYGTNGMKNITGSAVTGVTVSGANQDVTPVAYNSDGGYSAGETDDIRTQTLTVSAATLQNGDCFTIAGVNRIGIDSKNDSGQLMTFRVISGGGTTTPTISPAIVASGAYQNVSAAPANSAAITLINNLGTVEPTAFTTRDAVKFFVSDLDYSALEGSAQTVVNTYTTSSGLQIAMVRQGEIDDLSAKYRFTFWGKPNMKDPLKAGILLPSQSAAI